MSLRHFPLSAGKEIKFDGLSLSTCHSIINLMDVSFPPCYSPKRWTPSVAGRGFSWKNCNEDGLLRRNFYLFAHISVHFNLLLIYIFSRNSNRTFFFIRNLKNETISSEQTFSTAKRKWSFVFKKKTSIRTRTKQQSAAFKSQLCSRHSPITTRFSFTSTEPRITRFFFMDVFVILLLEKKDCFYPIWTLSWAV